GVRAEGFHPPAEFMRSVRAEENSDHLGTAAPRPRAQHRHLSSQSRRSGHRAVLRARSDGRRGAWLFRAAAVAPGYATTAKDLAGRQDQHLGAAAAAGFPSRAGLSFVIASEAKQSSERRRPGLLRRYRSSQ